MLVTDLPLAGLKLIEPRVFRDERGSFWEGYREPLYREMGIDLDFPQDNFSVSKVHTIRGLHYQPGQAKLVSVINGKIWDVAVDIRAGSQTYGHHFAIELDAESHRQFLIPDGFAHGFCALTLDAIVQYKVSAIYDPKAEKSIRWNDPFLQIPWPCKNPILSARDQSSPFWKEGVLA